ncbi:CU044_2847 family protein [Micromonospora sp. NPDC000089]|uniref:CU044_2847 family protein n=1 Tax=unclassified Micromonospora TaxID=2617518 RepID=UPI0036AB310F
MSPILVKVPVSEDGDEFIEVYVERRDLSGLELVAAGDDQAPRAARALTSSLERVLPALRVLVEKLRTAVAAPDEIGVELGLTVGGETGLVFTKGTAEATFTVNLTWRRDRSSGAAR